MSTDIPPKLRDFRNFLFLVWRHLKLPKPTDLQYSIAEFLQDDSRRIVCQAFRGCGKSWVTSAFVLWQLYLNPDKKIMVVSASKTRADDFSTFTLRLIHEMPLLQHLIPSDDQRQSKISFDVRPARASHMPSVKSVGITGQLSGNRADLIVADDCEVPNNSMTQTMRDKLSESIKEFESILTPNEDSKICFLGTPQNENSIYSALATRGYETRVWTSRFPTQKQMGAYGNNLAPFISSQLKEDVTLQGQPTEPSRFDDQELLEREASYGKTGFAMQFMLDCRLSDQDRTPLKLQDLIVMNCNPEKGPEGIVWARSPELRIDNIPTVGFAGDYFYRPMEKQGEWLEYTGAVMSVDPSGRGKDLTSASVIKMLNGNLYLTKCVGFSGGYDEDTLTKLINIAKDQKVNEIIVESNMGDGMFLKLLMPYVNKIYPCTTSEVRHNVQKERRICDVMEPILNQHRLVVDESVILEDYNDAQSYSAEQSLKHQLFYQLTRITRERGCLPHDDKLDSLSMAVTYFVEQMGKDQQMAIDDAKNEALRKDIDVFMDQAVGNWDRGGNSWIRH